MAEVTKRINLGLQGGGAHGAFTWGVLDYLLEDGRIELDAISGTSAGAMNAVVLAHGLMKNGYEGARQSLHDFWLAVSKAARLSPIQRTPIDILLGKWSLDTSPTYHFYDMMNQVTSPYQTNPLNINPLKDLLLETVDFETIRCCTKVRLYISATNVQTGRLHVFDHENLTCDMVMASACLPTVFQAVEIDGIPYWDGGYMGNPVLSPLYDTRCLSSDVVIIQINPLERKRIPKSAQEIENRVNEITFNSSLQKELRLIDFIHRNIEDGKLSKDDYKDIKVHIIECQEELKSLGASSKLNAEWAFLQHLFNIGRSSAKHWLEQNFDKLGVKSSVNLRRMFEGMGPSL